MMYSKKITIDYVPGTLQKSCSVKLLDMEKPTFQLVPQ